VIVQAIALLAIPAAVATLTRSSSRSLPRRVNRRPAAGADPGRSDPSRPEQDPVVDLPEDLVIELVAGLIASGTPPGLAAEVVRSAMAVEAVPAALVEVVAISEATGLPPVALLRARADDLRRNRDAAHGRAVRRLAVLLVLPMGLFLLPAFVLLGVVPLVLDLVVGR
jgi:hypothetical protein